MVRDLTSLEEMVRMKICFLRRSQHNPLRVKTVGYPVVVPTYRDIAGSGGGWLCDCANGAFSPSTRVER